jgi:flagellar biosynthesis protein FliQ
MESRGGIAGEEFLLAMSTAVALELFRQMLLTTFWLSLPILMIGFLAGIVISLIQIITSMQDASFGAVPRLAAFLFGLLLLMPWMLGKLMSYTTGLFGDLGRYAR